MNCVTAQHIEAQPDLRALGLAEVHGHCLMISGRAKQNGREVPTSPASSHLGIALVSIGWDNGGEL